MYEGYLTEEKLGDVLKVLFPNKTITKQKKFDEPFIKRLRFDYFIEEENMAVEYDGDSHYCRGNVNRTDLQKAIWCDTNGVTLIRIPYFLQLDRDAVRYFFNIEVPSDYKDPEFPQGFITKKVVMPSCFNAEGTKKFMRMMGDFACDGPKRLGLEIFDSLLKKRDDRFAYLRNKGATDELCMILACVEVFGSGDEVFFEMGKVGSMGCYS